MRFLLFGGPGIGDTIMELALAKSLKIAYPDSQIDIVISNTLGSYGVVSEILACQDYVTNYYCYSRKNIWQTIKTLIRLRVRNYNYSLSCTTAFKANAVPSKISRIIGCKSVIKEVKGKTGAIDIPVVIDERLHFVEQVQELCRKLVPDAHLDIVVLNPQKINDFFLPNINQKLVTICLGTNITIYWKDGKRVDKNIKAWDINRWISVGNELVERGVNVAFIGGKSELKELKSATIPIKKEIFNFVGKTNIHESLGIIKRSDLVVGADTGMMHCAAALDIKTISLFGGTDPNIWRPYSIKNSVITGKCCCAPCYGKEYAINCKVRTCMNLISYEEVLNSIYKRLVIKND